MGTYAGDDGIPVGEYAVLISWFPTDADTEVKSDKDRLGGRYNNPDKPEWTKTGKADNNNPDDFIFIVQ